MGEPTFTVSAEQMHLLQQFTDFAQEACGLAFSHGRLLEAHATACAIAHEALDRLGQAELQAEADWAALCGPLAWTCKQMLNGPQPNRAVVAVLDLLEKTKAERDGARAALAKAVEIAERWGTIDPTRQPREKEIQGARRANLIAQEIRALATGSERPVGGPVKPPRVGTGEPQVQSCQEPVYRFVGAHNEVGPCGNPLPCETHSHSEVVG